MIGVELVTDRGESHAGRHRLQPRREARLRPRADRHQLRSGRQRDPLHPAARHDPRGADWALDLVDEGLSSWESTDR